MAFPPWFTRVVDAVRTRNRREDNTNAGVHVMQYAALSLRDIAHALSNRVTEEHRVGATSLSPEQIARIRLANAVGGLLHHSDPEALLHDRLAGGRGTGSEFDWFERQVAMADSLEFARQRDALLETRRAIQAMQLLSDILVEVLGPTHARS